jgi:hypothetical protein
VNGRQVVVYWYEGAEMMPGPLPTGSLPPGQTRGSIGAMPTIEIRGDGWNKWQLSAAGYEFCRRTTLTAARRATIGWPNSHPMQV